MRPKVGLPTGDFLHNRSQKVLSLIVIGIDPHKSSHTATAVDPATNVDLGSLRIRSTEPEYHALLEWAGRWPENRWAVENAKGLGHHLALWLVRHGESVVDVPSTATARVRQLSRGGRRKNDRIDAAAAACVAALQGDERPLFSEDYTSVLRVLDERRRSLLSAKSRLVNQLHAICASFFPVALMSIWTRRRPRSYCANSYPTHRLMSCGAGSLWSWLGIFAASTCSSPIFPSAPKLRSPSADLS